MAIYLLTIDVLVHILWAILVLCPQNHAADLVEADADIEGPQAQGGEFRCEPPCKFKAKTAWCLQRHQNSKQGCIRLILSKIILANQTVFRGLVLNCDYCGENLGRVDKLRSHLKNNLCLYKHSCDMCPQKFSTWKLLREHKNALHKNAWIM